MRLRDPGLVPSGLRRGTPEEDHFIRDLLADEEGNARKGIKIITASSIENPTLPMTYFEQMGQQASPAFIKAQVMGGWVSGLGGQRFGNVFDMSMVGGMPLSRNDPGRSSTWLGSWLQHGRGRRLPQQAEARVVGVRRVRGHGTDYAVTLQEDPGARLHDEEHRWHRYRLRLAEDAVVGGSPKDNDFNVIYDAFGIRPRYLYNRHIFNKDLRTRLDVLERLMVQKRLLFNRDLMPRSTSRRRHQLDQELRP